MELIKRVTHQYKDSDIGLIPKDWEVYTLGESSTLHARIGWQGLRTDEYLRNGEYILVTGTDFENGTVDWEKCHFVDYQRFRQDRNIQLRPNDILVTKDGTIGKVAFIPSLPKPATLNSGVFVIRPRKRNYLPEFLFYVLQSKIFRKFLDELTAGSTITHLYQKDFVNFKFPVPTTKEEQLSISKALIEIDTLINSTSELIDKKEVIKRGAMQQLLLGKTRLPGFKKKWQFFQLGDVCEIISGGTPNTNNLNFWNGEIKWCTPTDITATSGKYLTDTERKITQQGLQNSSATVLPKGAILLCSRATIGEAKIAGSPVATNQGFKSLICSESVNNEFLYYLILLEKKKFISKAFGSTFLELSKKNTEEIELCFPSYEEQKKIGLFLSKIDQEIQSLIRKKNKLKDIKRGMIQKLVNGKIRLSKPISVPSSKNHNWAIDEAVVISTLVEKFGSLKFPLGRKRYTKYSYLLKRYKEMEISDYLKKAAGPYNPKTKYRGPEKIAQNNNYIEYVQSGKYHGYISNHNIKEALDYFDQWYGESPLDWMEQFRYAKNDELELWSTVDMAMVELKQNGKQVSLQSVKEVINSTEEWKPKLKRKIFSDENIEHAIEKVNMLFQ